MNVHKLCMNCMSEQLNENGVCMACGMKESAITTTKKHLPLRTILKGKYLVGRVIGEGGFGITYVGYDLDLEFKVAIKEFCPGNVAGREVTDSVTIMPFGTREKEVYESEKEKFINEAKRLAKFRKLEGVVSVLDYFQENNTAYIVMEYIEGMTLKEYCKQMSAPMQWDKLLGLIHPLVKSLDEIHATGMIHRDISADNIMISNDQKNVYLIDFGTARVWADGTLSSYEKDFYTPLEQTSETIEQGPWTDVYALCATIYYCMTGKRLPRVSDRYGNEQIVLPSQLGLQVPAYVEAALVEGLALHPDNRTRSMAELEQKLYGGLNVGQKDTQSVASVKQPIAKGVQSTVLTYSYTDVVERGEGLRLLEQMKSMDKKGRGFLATGIVLFLINPLLSLGWALLVEDVLFPGEYDLHSVLFVLFPIIVAVISLLFMFYIPISSRKKVKETWYKLFEPYKSGRVEYVEAQFQWLKYDRKKSSVKMTLQQGPLFSTIAQQIEMSSQIPIPLKQEWNKVVSAIFANLSESENKTK